MSALFRDTQPGQLVNYLSKGKLFQHPEQKSGFVIPDRYKPDTEWTPPSELSNASSITANNDSEQNSDIPKDAEKARSENKSDEKSQMSEQEKKDHRNTVDWYSEDDPENPLNWGVPKKVFVTFLICYLTTSIYIGSAVFTPGIMEAQIALNASITVVTLGLSLFVLGYAVGPVLGLAACTEIPSVGRTLPYIITLFLFFVIQFPLATVDNLPMFLVLRFFSGFFGSPVLATGGASLADMFSPKKRGYAMAVWGGSAVAGPTLGPLLAGFWVPVLGWKWYAYFLVITSGSALLLLVFALPETSGLNILVRRAQRLRKLTGNNDLTSEGEKLQKTMTGREIVNMSLIKPFVLIFTEPVVLFVDLYTGLLYAVIFTFIEAFVIVYVEEYGFSIMIQGLVYIGLIVGALVGIIAFILYNKFYLEGVFDRNNGTIEPEERMWPAMIGAFFIPVSLFWFGWTGRGPSVAPWYVSVISTGFFSAGATGVFQGILNYLPDFSPKDAASLLAGNDFVRASLGAAFPLFARQMYMTLGIGGASSLLGGLSVLMIPIPFLLHRYGKRLRQRSKSAE